MRLSLTPKCVTFITVLLLFQVIIIFLFNFLLRGFSKEDGNLFLSYGLWKQFCITMKDDCLNTSLEEYNMEKLVVNLDKLKTSNSRCKEMFQNFHNIFEVTHRYSEPVSFPSLFMKRMQKNLSHKLFKNLFHQMLVHVFNRLTFESSAYNPLRAERPRLIKEDENIWDYVDRISKETEKDCDFCNYKRHTALNELGRHKTEFTVRISNSFKLEKWHGMIITKSHHPTNFSLEELEMMMNEVVRWANEVEILDPAYIYPSASWDVLYKAGASQIHPHIHVTVSPNHYYGSIEQYRVAAQAYFEQTGENLFSKLVEIYSSLGLAVRYGEAVALSTLVGKGDLEVMIISANPSSDLFRLLYFTIKVYHDLDFPCYSMAMAWSSVGSSAKANYRKIPAIIRIMPRGDCLSNVSDMSSLDLFLTNYRDHDPWFLARLLQKKLEGQ